MRYICMTCGKLYNEDKLPVVLFNNGDVNNGDGCCSIGSLLEVKEENINIGNWLILGDHVFDKSKGRSEQLKPSIE